MISTVFGFLVGAAFVVWDRKLNSRISEIEERSYSLAEDLRSKISSLQDQVEQLRTSFQSEKWEKMRKEIDDLANRFMP